MGNVELHDRANDYFVTLLEQVPSERLDDQTPCPDWKVRDLVDHVVGGNLMFANVVRGDGSGPQTDPSTLGDDPVKAVRASAQEASEAWHAPGVTEQMVTLPFGTLPGEIAIGIHYVDVVVHSWDLAKTMGFDIAAFPADLVEPALALAQLFPDSPEIRGPGKPFGPVVEVPEDAPALERLVGRCGRQP